MDFDGGGSKKPWDGQGGVPPMPPIRRNPGGGAWQERGGGVFDAGGGRGLIP